MKKFGLAVLGIIAAIIILANLGSLLALALSAFIAYVGYHYFTRSLSTFGKIMWGTVIVISLLTAISNVPAFFGILALFLLLFVWKKWKEQPKSTFNVATDDPFVNFEKQWDELTK